MAVREHGCRAYLDPELTKGLGRHQRAVLDYLARAPYGFADAEAWDERGRVLRHGAPYAVTIKDITLGVHGEDYTETDAQQVRRSVHGLAAAGLAVVDMRPVGSVEREILKKSGETAIVTRPVKALKVSLRGWTCEHRRGRQAPSAPRPTKQKLLTSGPSTAMMREADGTRVPGYEFSDF